MARKDERPLRPRKNRAAGVFWIGLAARALRSGGMSGPFCAAQGRGFLTAAVRSGADRLQAALCAGLAAAFRRMIVLLSAQ